MNTRILNQYAWLGVLSNTPLMIKEAVRIGKLNTNEIPGAKSNPEIMKLAAARLQHTQIENDDACKIIKLRDTEDTFHYIDPPYVGANQGHYGGYTQEHFEELLITLSQCKGKFLLSSYHNEALTTFVKEFGWYQKEITLHLGSSKTKGKREWKFLLQIIQFDI